jgi:hypothetical protein
MAACGKAQRETLPADVTDLAEQFAKGRATR